jgi:hypothetical protein
MFIIYLFIGTCNYSPNRSTQWAHGIAPTGQGPPTNEPKVEPKLLLSDAVPLSPDAISANTQQHPYVRYKVLKVMNMKLVVFTVWCQVVLCVVTNCSNQQYHCCCVCIGKWFNDSSNWRLYSNNHLDEIEWWHGKGIESSGIDMIKGNISGSEVDWRGHGKAWNLSDIFVVILDVIRYFYLVRKTKDIFSTMWFTPAIKYPFCISQ